jgi:hypothetical protein
VPDNSPSGLRARSSSLARGVQPGQHPHADRGHDFYETPRCAVEALLAVEKLPHWLWEPAAGRGAIVNVLRDRGHAVIASDVVGRGFPLHFVGDFLETTRRRSSAARSSPTRRA